MIHKKDPKYSEVKIIEKGFNTPAVFNIFKDKTAIIIWNKDPIGIFLDSKETSSSFRQYFKMLWSLAKKIE